MERVSQFLELQTEPVSRNVVESNVKGKAEYVRTAIDVLVAEGFVNEVAGPRHAKQLSRDKPFSTSSDLVRTN